MKIEQLQPGQVVYDVARRQMGNTTIRTVAVWDVKIQRVDLEGGQVLASWNGNQARLYGRRVVARWRKNRPVLVRTGMVYRLATRDELKTMRQEALAAHPCTDSVGNEK